MTAATLENKWTGQKTGKKDAQNKVDSAFRMADFLRPLKFRRGLGLSNRPGIAENPVGCPDSSDFCSLFSEESGINLGPLASRPGVCPVTGGVTGQKDLCLCAFFLSRGS